MVVGIPSLFVAVWLLKNSPIPEQPSLIATIILGMAATNFAAVIFLEKYRDRLGRLTLHALLTVVGMVLLYIVTDALNRYVSDIGYHWLYPPVLAAIGVIYIALFREKHFWIKCLLAADAVMIAGLWCLGITEKLALPF